MAAKEEAAATKADIERRAIIEEEKMDKIEIESNQNDSKKELSYDGADNKSKNLLPDYTSKSD